MDKMPQTKKENEEKKSLEPAKKKNRILFWIFATLAFLFVLGFWINGFPAGTYLMTLFWIIFLGYVWWSKKISVGFLIATVAVGLVLVVWSILFFSDLEEADKNDTSKNNSQVSENVQEEAQEAKCDDVNSQYKNFHGVEKVVVSQNPCKVIWLLAKEYEKYELKTKKGTVLKAIVWNDYVNNVKAGDSYTIRVLDVDSDSTGKPTAKAQIAIMRWVKNKAGLPQAKKEVQEVVEELDY